MSGRVWLLAMVWICVAGCLCNGLEDSLGETGDKHLDYKFDTSYIAMKKAASGINLPNSDVMVIYGMEAASLYYAFTHRVPYLSELLHSNSTKVYGAVLDGACVPPPSRDQGRCLTEREARTLMFKEGRLTLYSAAALITEAGVRTRLQWFKENGADDVVLMVSANVQILIRDVALALIGPIHSFYKQLNKFKSIIVHRYTSGTGSAYKMVSTADAVFNQVYAFMGAIISKKYPFLKFYHSTQQRTKQYSVMFQDHLETVLSMPRQEMHQDSPYPVINRYWDARALEYAVTWIFKMRKEVREAERKELDKVLEDLYNKLVAGETEASLESAGHTLSKTMDRLGHKVFSKYLEQPMQEEIMFLSIPVPVNLEDLNPLRVPKSLFEADMSPIENSINHYLDEAEEESVGKLLFSQIVSLM